MPKSASSGVSSTPLSPAEATAKITGLITETSDDELPVDSPADETSDAAETSDAPGTPPPAETPDSESQTPDTELYEVPVDGENVQVDLDELKAGYSFKAHNTKEAQRLAAREKELEAVEAEGTRARAENLEMARQFREALEQLQGEPDWVKRRAELSAEDFLKEKADWEATQASVQKLKAKEQQLAEEQRQAEAQQFQKYVRAEQDKLRAAVPDWADGEKAKVEAAKLRAHAKTYGFTDKEIDGVVDHRTILLLRDAMQYQALKREPSEQAKKKAPAIRTAKPGAGAPPPAPNARQKELMDRAVQSHRTRDIAKAIETLID